jgi:Uma2 family endonuclease
MTPAVAPPPLPGPFRPVGSGAATPLPPPAVPTPFRWTIAEYRQLGQLDVFRGRKTFLLRGIIYIVAQPNPPHDTALGLAGEWLRGVFNEGHHIRIQMGFDVGTEHDPGPDLAVVPGSIRDYSARMPTSAVLIVEVSETSLSMDITGKAEAYATARVPDYWVIDLVKRQIHVFRDPVPLPEGLEATAYRTHLTFGPTDTVSPLAVPTATITVADLLP